MGLLNLDGLNMDLTCPKCGQKFTETFGRVKDDQLFFCPFCGVELGLRTNRQAKALELANEHLAFYVGKSGVKPH
jgi:transposase-like protein